MGPVHPHHYLAAFDKKMPTNSDRASSHDIFFGQPGTARSWIGKSADQEWAIHQGSALEILKGMSPGSVDCTVTSPPYYWLRDCDVKGQIGLEDTVDDYVSALAQIMAEARWVPRRHGVGILNLGDTYYSGKGMARGIDAKSKKRRFGLRAVDKSGGLRLGLQRKSLIGIPWRVALALVVDGWVLRSAIIWHRTNGLREFIRNRPSRVYEHVFILARNRHYYFDRKDFPHKIEEGMWTYRVQPQSNGCLSSAPIPDELVERCLKIGCPEGGVVLDPFVGSGTSVRVAINTGRPGIGRDLNGVFCS